MNTQKSISKVIWAVTAGIMVFTIVLYAATDRSGESQAQQQKDQIDKAEQSRWDEASRLNEQRRTDERRSGDENRAKAGQSSRNDQSQQQQMHPQSRQMATQAGVLCRLDDLLGSDVRSKSMQSSSTMNERSERQESTQQRDDGQIDTYGRSIDEPNATLGTVEEVILGDQNHEIRYIILQSDSKNYLIPWQAFHVKTGDVRGRSGSDALRQDSSDRSSLQSGRSSTGHPETSTTGQRQDSAGSSSMSYLGFADSSKPVLYLNLSQDQLKQAPTVDSISVEAVSDSQLKQRVDSFYSAHIASQARQFKGSSQQRSSSQASQQQITSRDPQTATDGLQSRDFDQRSMASGRLFKATDVVGLELKSSQDDSNLGTIKDMVVDTREGQIAYGLVDFGGFLGMGQKVAVVPWSSVTIDADLEDARITATSDQLNAAVLEDDNIDKLSEAQFANNIHKTFNAEPYWQVYGYVPAEDGTSEPKKNDDWQQTQQQKTEQQRKIEQQQKTEQQRRTEQQQKSQ